MRLVPYKDVFKKYIESYFKEPEYQREFKCRYPKYLIQLEGIIHFKRYAYDVHWVFYQYLSSSGQRGIYFRRITSLGKKLVLNITYLYITQPKTLQLRYLTRCLTQLIILSLATALNRSFFLLTYSPYNIYQIRYLQFYLGLAAGYSIRGIRQDLGQISKVQA